MFTNSQHGTGTRGLQTWSILLQFCSEVNIVHFIVKFLSITKSIPGRARGRGDGPGPAVRPRPRG